VNETDSGTYYKHPHWKDLEYGDGYGCRLPNLETVGNDDLTPLLSLSIFVSRCAGEELIQYRSNQFSSVEAKLQNQLTLMWNIVAIALIAYRCKTHLQWRGLATAARYGLVSAVLGYVGAINVLGHSVRGTDVLVTRDCRFASLHEGARARA
jgi:hypothetical protein